MNSLIIINNSIRLNYNELLNQAINANKKTFIAYLHSEEIIHQDQNCFHWVKQALGCFNNNINHNLHWVPYKDVDKFINDNNITQIFVNKFAGTEAQLFNKGLPNCTVINDFLLFNYDEVVNKQGEPYKVYTPFAKFIASLPVQQYSSHNQDKLLKLLQLDENYKFQNDQDTANYQNDDEPTEQSAISKLKGFLQNHINSYDIQRNMLDNDNGTSKLSHYINNGIISLRYVLQEAKKCRSSKGSETYIKEIYWREFSYHLLHHFNSLADKNFNSKFNNFPWGNNQEYIEKWKSGKTGYDIIDAAMHELNTTGLMHNRSRMITASFLTKNLLVDWRIGAQYFKEKLLDYNEASNFAGWQWVAGSGADAAPYFRVFNPVLQAAKFDPSQKYRSKFLPTNYFCLPLVDLASSRDKALLAFEKIK